MNRLMTFAIAALLSATAIQAGATTYEISGTSSSIGSYTDPGSSNMIFSGDVSFGGTITTDSAEEGYTVLDGDVTMEGTISLTALGFDVDLIFDLKDGDASDAGVIFNLGTVCVTLTGTSGCVAGQFTVGTGPGDLAPLDFSSGGLFLGGSKRGLQLSGGAGGTSFEVAQPGGVTPTLGFDPTDWTKAVGFISILGVDAGIFVGGNLTFTETVLPPPPPPPINMIVIQLDDVSVDAMQALLDGGWLPNISTHLVDAGVSFENSFVTTPEGTPSRATLLTGQYAHNHGVYSDQTPHPLEGGIKWAGWLPEAGQTGREQSTIATWLQNAGYRTGFIGKYLNGYGEQAPAGVSSPETYIPAGWDNWSGLIGRSAYRMYDYYLNENGVVVHYGETEADYLTDVLAAQAVDFIADAQSDPFFLLVSSLASRVEVTDAVAFVTGNDPLAELGLGIRPAPRHAHLSDGDESNDEMPPLQFKPSFNEGDVSGKPSCPRPLPPVEPALVSDPICVAERPLLAESDITLLSSQYKAMLASAIAADDLVGAVIDELNAGGKLDNTAIVLTSDNGRLFGEHRLFNKQLAYEESIRVPLIVRTPGGKTGTRSAAMVLNNDIAPTLADLAGVTPPYTPDGVSLLPLIEVVPESPWPERQNLLVEHWYIPSLIKFDSPTYLAWRGVSQEGSDFTYIATRAAPSDFAIEVTGHEFYDLSVDPHQLSSIALPADIEQYFDIVLRVFEGCAGSSCRNFETP